MPSKGEIIFDLKKNKIFPKNQDYSDHIINWFQTNVDHKISQCDRCKKFKCTKKSWLENFSFTFKKEVRQKWNQNSSEYFAIRTGLYAINSKVFIDWI